MRNTLARTLPGALFAAIMLFSATAWSAGPHPGPPDDDEMLARLTQRLELNDSQREQIAELLDQSRDEMQADHRRLRELHAALRAQRRNFDEAEAHRLADEFGEVTARSAYRRSSNYARIYALLTPEQQQEMDQLMDERGYHREKHLRQQQP